MSRLRRTVATRTRLGSTFRSGKVRGTARHPADRPACATWCACCPCRCRATSCFSNLSHQRCASSPTVRPLRRAGASCCPHVPHRDLAARERADTVRRYRSRSAPSPADIANPPRERCRRVRGDRIADGLRLVSPRPGRPGSSGPRSIRSRNGSKPASSNPRHAATTWSRIRARSVVAALNRSICSATSAIGLIDATPQPAPRRRR